VIKDYNDFTDEELVEISVSGDSDAKEYLIRKYMSEVRSKARLYFIMGGDAEDVVQEGMIGILKAIHAYDESRGVPFHAFMNMCVNRQIYTAIESAGRLKNAPLNDFASLTTSEGETNPDVANIRCGFESQPEELLIYKDMVDDLINNAEKLFGPLELQVWKEYLRGKDYNEIAKTLGKSPKAVDNAIQRIKKKITGYLNC
jgi:RNA polymerase sporulation-specific sigma factor